MPKGRHASGEDALTPVLGPALMVAVLVAMAIAVSVVLRFYLKDSDSDAGPQFALQRDEQADRLLLLTAEAGLDWTHFEIRADAGGVANFALKAEATQTSPALTGSFQPIGSGATVEGGDFIEFCGDTNGAAAGGGGVAAVTLKDICAESVPPAESFPVKVTVKVPAAVGVPLIVQIAPLAEALMPTTPDPEQPKV